MKRGKLLLGLLVCVVMLSGCGKDKTLTCTMDASQSGMEMKSTALIKFKGNKIEDMSVTVDATYPEGITDAQKQLFVGILKTQSEQQDMTVEETDNGIKLTASKDSKYFSNLNLDEGKADYDEVKESLETAGFTCK